MALKYEYKMKVRYYECDTQGVVNHANYLHYFETARLELMVAGGAELEKLAAMKIDPMVRNANVTYISSLHNGDEFVCGIEIERKGIRYFFNQTIIRIADNTLCAKAKIEIVCLVDGKVSKPKIMDEIFAEYLTWL